MPKKGLTLWSTLVFCNTWLMILVAPGLPVLKIIQTFHRFPPAVTNGQTRGRGQHNG